MGSHQKKNFFYPIVLFEMKKSSKQQQAKGNTLFNYFQKTNEKKKPEPLSSVIARHTSTITTKSITTITPKTEVKKASLSNSKLITTATTATKPTLNSNIITAEHKPTLSNTTSSETSLERNYIDLTMDESPPSGQGSFKSAEHSVSMTNNSKFNKKAWAPIDSRRGPLRSSQESSPSPRRITPQFNKVVPISRPATSMPRYDWLGDNDVKPYSSNYVPYNSTSTNAFEKRPRVLPYAVKRPLEDENSVSFYSNKRRQPPTGISSDLWSRTNDVRKRRTTKEAPLAPPMSSYSAPATYRPTLSAEQQRVLDMVLKDKKSLFFTGSAGTGKSVLLRAIIDEMETIYGPMLAVTASTGIAATNINGCTLHR